MSLDRLRLAIVLLPLVEALFKLRASLQRRIAWLESRAVGKLEGVCVPALWLLKAESALVWLTSLGAAGAFLVGVLKEFGPRPFPIPTLWRAVLGDAANSFFEWSWLLAALWVMVAVEVWLWLGMHLLLGMRYASDSFAAYRPGYISLRRLVRQDASAGNNAINVDEDSCRRVADELVPRVPAVPGAAWVDEASQDSLRAALSVTEDLRRAVRPAGVDTIQRANLLLAANVFESQRNRLNLGWDYAYRHLYAVLGFVAREKQLFSAEALRELGDTSFYETLRRAALEIARRDDPDREHLVDELIPSRAALRDALDRLVRGLVDRYAGRADRLPFGRVSQRASRSRLMTRLKGLPGCDWESTRRQVLKLGRLWDVWPDIDPGPLFYAFAPRLASFLLSSGCLVVPADQRSVERTEDLERVVTWTEHRIVTVVNDLRHNRDDFWGVAAEVDFALWSLGGPGGGLESLRGVPWEFDGNGFCRQGQAG